VDNEEAGRSRASGGTVLPAATENVVTARSEKVAGRPLELRPDQLDLVEALQQQPGKFDYACMYMGALYTLDQADNPLRFVLAAHALRELMEKLPASYGVPEPEGGMKSDVMNLRDKWSSVVKATRCRTAEGWAGQVDKPLGKFLQALDAFFAKFTEQYHPRKVQADTFLRAAELRPVPLPTVIVGPQVEQWADCREYFVRVAHHGRDPGNEFGSRLSFLERFLLDRLAPRAHADRADIDRLIARGEGR
jgi:hypothetical protein